MENNQEKPWHFQDLQRMFPQRSESEIGDAIMRLRKEIGASKNRAEVMAHLSRELES